jgi:hypothetical protein
MKTKLLAFLGLTLLLPAITFASFDPLGWLKDIKITTYAKPKDVAVATTSTTTMWALIDPIRNSFLAGAAAAISGDGQNTTQSDSDQIAQLKSQNDAFKKTIASLQTKISSMTSQYATDLASCQQNISQVKSTYTPQNLDKIKSLEFSISGDISDNFRDKIDEYGQTSGEKTLNIQFFRDPQTGADFMNTLKQYDSMMKTHLVNSAQVFLNATGDGISEFQDFYSYFQSVRMFSN